MIVFDEVAKRYAGGYTALAGVSCEIRHGELVVLSGHSGAGKSTLLKLIAVIERPSAGRVLINGEDVSRLPGRRSPICAAILGWCCRKAGCCSIAMCSTTSCCPW